MVQKGMLVVTALALAIGAKDISREVDQVIATKGVERTAEGLVLRSAVQTLEAIVKPSGAVLRSVARTKSQGDFAINPVRMGTNGAMQVLPGTGDVATETAKAITLRRGPVTERFTASADGITQDFIIAHRPGGSGPLSLELAVKGASVSPLAEGVKLTLPGGRELVYQRLFALDAQGKGLPATMLNLGSEGIRIEVDDAGATYPVTIDPTVTDANWFAMNTDSASTGEVASLAADSSGNLYIGGSFTKFRGNTAKNIVMWNGSGFSSVDIGCNGTVTALAWGGGKLYAGGNFTTCGFNTTPGVAVLVNGSWGTIGLGIPGGGVNAILPVGSKVYFGGAFINGGGIGIQRLAVWTGSSWGYANGTPNLQVRAFKQWNGNLYVAGDFTQFTGGSQGTVALKGIAMFDGSSWNAVGSNFTGSVYALDTLGGNLVLGGIGFKLSNVAVNNVASWDGTTMTALGTGISTLVRIMASDGQHLYVGGDFNAPGTSRWGLARWNDTTWSDIGSGVSGSSHQVLAMAKIHRKVVVGGIFNNAGGLFSGNVAGFDIPRDTQAIVFDTLCPHTYGDSAVTLVATSNSGLKVTFSSSDTTVVKVMGDTALAIRGAGMAYVTAHQAGDSLWLPAPDVLDSITIAPLAITVTGVVAQPRFYNGSTALTLGGTPALVGILAGDSSSVAPDTNNTTAHLVDKNAGPAHPVVIDQYFLQGPAAHDYTITPPSGLTVDIWPDSLTTSGFTCAPKEYDGTIAATVTGDTLLGVITGDTVSVGSVSAHFGSKSVWVSKQVLIDSVYLTGKDSANYVVKAPRYVIGKITAKELTVQDIVVNPKTYDGITDASFGGGTLVGVIPGDTVNIDGIYGGFADRNAGLARPVNVTYISVSGKDWTNYHLTLPTDVTGDVSPKSTGVDGIFFYTKTYDGTDVANASGGQVYVSGDSVGVGAIYAHYQDSHASDIMPKTIVVDSIHLTGRDSANYVGQAFGSYSGYIWPKALQDSGLQALDKTYDGGDSVQLSGGYLVGVIPGDDVQPGTFLAHFRSAGAGTGIPVDFVNATLGGASKSDYTLDLPTTISADILPKPLTFWVNDVYKTYGMPDPTPFTWSDSGFVAGEGTWALPGSLSIVRDTGLTHGTYAIHASGYHSSNYDITYVDGHLTIDKSSQTLSFTLGNTMSLTGPTAIKLLGHASSGLPVSYVASDPSVAYVSGDTLYLLQPGIDTITAHQDGDTNHFAATPMLQVMTVQGQVPNAITIYANMNPDTVQTDAFSLTWNSSPTPVLYYGVQLATDSSFANIVLQDTTLDTTYSFQGKPNGTYWWRAWAHNAQGWSPAGNHLQLVLDNQGPTTLQHTKAASLGLQVFFDRVEYELPQTALVRLQAFGLDGSHLRDLVQETQGAGHHVATLGAIPTGAWILRLSAGTQAATHLVISP